MNGRVHRRSTTPWYVLSSHRRYPRSLALRSLTSISSSIPPSPFPLFFFFKDTATPEIYPLPLHDALPISGSLACAGHDGSCWRSAFPHLPQNAVYPPSITKQSAVWYDDALLIRYTAIPPKSEGSPNRRIRIRGITAPTNFSLAMIPEVKSRFIPPGRAGFEGAPSPPSLHPP